jgi:predicted methyltransferase
MPSRVLAFFDIGPGDKVADLLAGSGYYTRILAPVVGSEGEVYSGNNPFFQRFGEEALTALLAEPGFENVRRIDGPVDELALPMDASLDAVIMVLAYHDLWLTDEDRDELNRRVFAAGQPASCCDSRNPDRATEFEVADSSRRAYLLGDRLPR